MAQLALHHVNVIITDLPRSVAFYQRLFGLTIIERPAFKNAGAWLNRWQREGMACLMERELPSSIGQES
jgi:catechol 2,3-dioxygenase-like lactoylglutathione lyase family enzyme